jgi:hypothetical protein
VSRVVVNMRAWPGRVGWRAARSARAPVRRLRDRTALVITAMPMSGVLPELLGLAAWLVVFGPMVLDAGFLTEGTAPSELRRWARAHPIASVRGTQPWRVLDLVAFNRTVLAHHGYRGRCPIIGADLLRTFGLLAERWWRPKRPPFTDGFAFGLHGWGRQLARASGSSWWSRDFGMPVVYAHAVAARALHMAYGTPRPYVTRDGSRERRGIWEANGAAYKGTFIELLGAAHTFDAIDSGELAEHLDAFAIQSVVSHSVRPDSTGAQHISELVRAQHALACALDEEAQAW